MKRTSTRSSTWYIGDKWSGSRSGYLTVVEPQGLTGYEIYEGSKQSACACADRNNNSPLQVMEPQSLDPSLLDCTNTHTCVKTLRNLTKKKHRASDLTIINRSRDL